MLFSFAFNSFRIDYDSLTLVSLHDLHVLLHTLKLASLTASLLTLALAPRISSLDGAFSCLSASYYLLPHVLSCYLFSLFMLVS
jgi:hypothetical protein